MKRGDLVQPNDSSNARKVPIYDIPFVTHDQFGLKRRLPEIVHMLATEETAVILELTRAGTARVLLNSGATGWVSTVLLKKTGQ